MESVYKPPNILRLTGITMKDYVPVEDVADTRLLDPGTDGSVLEPDDPAPESIHPPDKIPRVFTGLDDWPHHTNLRCWECGFTFDDRPKFVPTYVREAENGGIEFGVHGNFCTFNHSELWIETHLGGRASNEDRWRAQDNLCLVYFLFTGRRIARIKPGYSKTELRQYGGDWDEDTYWRKMRELDPVAGLRDHTPGSVIPERDRVKAALAVLKTRASVGASPAPRALATEADAASRKPAPGEPIVVSANSVWGVCGLPPMAPAPAREGADSVAVGGSAPTGGVPLLPRALQDDNLRAPESEVRQMLEAVDRDLEVLLAERDQEASLEALLAERDQEANLEALLAEQDPAAQNGAAPILVHEDAPPIPQGGENGAQAGATVSPAPSAAAPDSTPREDAMPSVVITDADVDDLFADLGLV